MRLNRKEKDRARELLVSLKRQGFSPDQMEEMTKKKWNKNTIRFYTKGVRIEDSLAPAESLDVIGEMSALGLTLQDMQQANAIKRNLDRQGVSMNEVADLIEDVHSSGMTMGVKTLLSYVKDVRESGISIGELGQIRNYQKSLEGMGINERRLGELFRLVSTVGGNNFEKGIRLVKGVGNLEQLKGQINQALSTKHELESKVKSLESQVADLLNRKSVVQASLDLVQKLEDNGFNKAVLDRLKTVSEKHGGPDKVLRALDEYVNTEVLKTEIGMLEKEKAALEIQISELKKNLATLQAQTIVLEKSVNKTLEGMQFQLYGSLDDAAKSMQTTFDTEKQRLTQVIDAYAATAKEAAIFGVELELVRIFLAAKNDPNSIHNVSASFAFQFLELATSILVARGNTTKTSGGYRTVTETLLDVLMALRAERLI